MQDKTSKLCGSKFKLIYATLQIFLFYLGVCLLPQYHFLFILGVAVTYLIPLYINSYSIKFVDKDIKLSRYYFIDAVYYLLPSIMLSLLIEMGLYFSGVVDKLVGLNTIILSIIFVIFTLFQWLKYFVQYKMVKRAEALDSEDEEISDDE